MPFPTREGNWKEIFVQMRNHLIQPDSLSDVGDSSEGSNCTWRSFTSSKKTFQRNSCRSIQELKIMPSKAKIAYCRAGVGKDTNTF